MADCEEKVEEELIGFESYVVAKTSIVPFLCMLLILLVSSSPSAPRSMNRGILLRGFQRVSETLQLCKFMIC